MEEVIREFIENNYIFVNQNQKTKFTEEFTEIFNKVAENYDLTKDSGDDLYTPELREALLDTFLQVPTRNGRRKKDKADYPTLSGKNIQRQHGRYLKIVYDFSQNPYVEHKPITETNDPLITDETVPVP